MTTITIDYNGESRTIDVLSQAVYTKARWGNSWAADPTLHCENAVWTYGGDVPTATLVRDYGLTRLPGEADYSTRIRVDLTGYFVLVAYQTHDEGVLYWLGFIESIDSDAAAADSSNVLHGTQRFYAYGLERAMDRIRIDKTIWRNGSDVFDGNATTVFNKFRTPNRSDAKYTNGDVSLDGYVFENDQSVAEYWTIRDIVEHLIAWHTLRDSSGGVTIAFDIQNLSNIFTLNFTPEWSPEGHTLRSAINYFVQPQNFLQWYLKYAPTGDPITQPWQLTIVIDSLGDSTTTLPSGATQPPAGLLIQIEADADPLTTTRLSDSGVVKFDQVRVRGDRKKFVFSNYIAPVNTGDPDWEGFFVPAWTTDDENAYIDGATGQAGYSSLSDGAKKQANARARERYSSVYAKYKRNLKWDCLDGAGNAVFGLDEDDEPIKPAPHTILVQPELPLYQLVDYAGSFETIDESGGQQKNTGLVPNLLWLHSVDKSRRFNSRDFWILNSGGHSNDETPFPEIEMFVEDEGETVTFQVTNAEQLTINNRAAQTAFPKATTLHRLMVDPALSVFTLCVTNDEYCEATWPTTPPADRDSINVETFYAGENFQWVKIVDDTIVDLGLTGTAVYAGGGTGGVIRDHSPVLLDLARLIYAWHGVTRRNLVLNTTRIDSRWAIGALITTSKEGSGTATVNSTISRMQITSQRSLNGYPAAPVMTVSTQVRTVDWQRTLGDLFGGR